MRNASGPALRARAGIIRCSLTAALATGIAACAPSPEAIAPVQVSSVRYQGMECRALIAQVAAMDRGLAALSGRQRAARANDVAKSVFLLHPRATVVGPDMVPTIALAKGERAAAAAVLQARC
jgi:hypothetical protein